MFLLVGCAEKQAVQSIDDSVLAVHRDTVPNGTAVSTERIKGVAVAYRAANHFNSILLRGIFNSVGFASLLNSK